MMTTTARSRWLVAALMLGLGCEAGDGSYDGPSIAEYLAAFRGETAPAEPLPAEDPPRVYRAAAAAVATDEGLAAFDRTVYPTLREHCADCHAGAGPGTPHIAHPDLQTAYDVVIGTQKVNFGAPETSRLVRRLANDSHYCWSDCDANATVMAAQIESWALAEGRESDASATTVDTIRSGTRTLAEGVEDGENHRFDQGAIARFEFKEGAGNLTRDTSGVAPAMDLALIDEATLMPSYGIAFAGGHAIASEETSRKLYDAIAHPYLGSQQYTIEAWVTPANVTQEGPARIVSYSRSSSRRNFTLGQVLYNYHHRNRSIDPEVDDNGRPGLQTSDADQDLQATLQHVIVTYDQYRGRRIYVNSNFTDDDDESHPNRLWNWDPTYRFVLGAEVNGERSFEGQVRFVAVYPFVLTDEQIVQNFHAGVGKRLLLRFDISSWIGPDSWIEFVVSELDDYSYLFCEPRLFTPNPTGFRASNLRVAVNGVIPVSGQAFVNTQRIVSQSGQRLSRQCSVVLKDRGPSDDVFSIEFEYLGSFRDPVVASPVPPPTTPVFGEALPLEGVRGFERIRETMAVVTGVDPNEPEIRDTYEELRQALPGTNDLRAFSAAQQVAISKLALEYCDALVESVPLRNAFFGASGIDFDAPTLSAFGTPGGRASLIDPLVANMLGTGIANQPSAVEVGGVLDDLLDDLTLGCDAVLCPASHTRTVTKAACAAVLSSAAVMVH